MTLRPKDKTIVLSLRIGDLILVKFLAPEWCHLITWLFLFLIICPDEKEEEREEKSNQPSERETLAEGKLAS